MQNKPSFLVIGAQKAGTSWLWVQLRKNPSIWLPPIKELHFFDHLHMPENRQWTTGHIRKGALEKLKWQINSNPKAIDYSFIEYLSRLAYKNMFTETWYCEAFDRPGAKNKILGDITPEYSTIPEEGIQYLKSFLPANLKLIYIIRDPISRALSQLRMNIERRNLSINKLSMKEWSELTNDKAINNRGDYATYIPRWDKYFTNEQILYIPYKSLSISPEKTIETIENFIGADNFKGYRDLSSKVHVTKKIEIPNHVSEELTNRFSEQYDFLNHRFDEEFLKNT